MSTITVIILIIVGFYVISRVDKEIKQQIKKGRFSYKLEVAVTPKWYKILQHQYPKLSEKKLDKFISDNKKKSSELSLFQNVFPRFVEFYDNVSGMRVRHFERWQSNKNSWRGFCDEFELEGNIFDFESIGLEKEDEKLKIKINECSITTMRENKTSPDGLFEEDKVLSYIPLEGLKGFFIELGSRFHDIEMNPIIKWPEKFQKIFKKHDIKYFHWNGDDYEPEIFDIAKHDKKFFEKWKGLKIALYGGSSNQSHRFETKYANYDVRIKLFRPER